MRISRVIRSVAVLAITVILVTGAVGQEDTADSVVSEQESAGTPPADVEPKVAAASTSDETPTTRDAEDSIPDVDEDVEGESKSSEGEPELECDCEAAISVALDEAREDYDRLEDELENLKTDRSNLQAENLELKAREIRLSSEVTAHVATMERQSNEISSLKELYARSQSRIAELTTEVQELLERVANFKPQVSIIVQIGKLVKKLIVDAREFIGSKL